MVVAVAAAAAAAAAVVVVVVAAAAVASIIAEDRVSYAALLNCMFLLATHPGTFSILLLCAWIRVKGSLFPHYFIRQKSTGIVTTDRDNNLIVATDFYKFYRKHVNETCVH
jgi:hypothetical protein